MSKAKKDLGVLVFPVAPGGWKSFKLGDAVNATSVRKGELCGLDAALYDERLNLQGSIYQLDETKENDRVEYIVYIKNAS